MRNKELSSGYAKELRRVEPDVAVRIFHFVPTEIPVLNELLHQMERVSAAMSILFPVTGNGGSRSEANLQLKNVLAEHHLQYGFRAVNFVICPTATGGLEAPIEEWKREFAEFAEWSWEIKDSVGTMGMWRGQVAGGQVADEAMDLAPFAPATTATLAAIVVAAPVVGAPFAAAVAAHAFWRWIRRRDPP